MPILPSLPENATLGDLRSRHSELFGHMRPYAQQLMRGPSPLSPGERELIAAYVSGTNACQYCYGAHSRTAQGFGIDEKLFLALMENIDTAPINTKLKPILKYARKLTQTPSRMTRADAEAVYGAGWNEEALVHAIAVCAYFNQMNRLVQGAGIVGTTDDYAKSAERLVARGYQP
jgi:uncharacterized peroxidase-related enzyme